VKRSDTEELGFGGGEGCEEGVETGGVRVAC
jgi:hypothetical protein